MIIQSYAKRVWCPPLMEFRIRPLQEEDLQTADHIMRVAFGTYLGVPEPENFGEGMDHVKTRWLADPTAAFGAEADGELVGSCFVTRWGSFGFFGPLTVRPDLWDRGVAKLLLGSTMELFNKWHVNSAGLFTFADSPKHLGLYQKFGFWPRFLTLVMSKPVQQRNNPGAWSKFSDVPDVEKGRCLVECRSLTNSIYEGLDLEREIVAVRNQRLGDTVLLWEGETLAGIAVCHCGPGTEAGRDTCYIKFGAVRKGSSAEVLDKLLDACEELATMHGMARVLAGVNTACHDMYQRMIARGFRVDFQGIAMLRPNKPSFDRPDCYVMCDLR
jgi:predicted N-acetyltransferase YhbS